MFSNNQVDIDQLPAIADIDYKPLQKEYLNVELIAATIFWAVVFIAIISIFFVADVVEIKWVKFVVLTGALILAGMSYTFLILEFKRMKYALREHDIIYSSGYVWRENTVVPFSRIQHVEVTEGPIDRLFDLSKLKIYTAGGSSSDLSIPGLLPKQAESLKHFILNRNRMRDEEE